MPWYDKFMGRKTHILKPSGGMLFSTRGGPQTLWVPGKWVMWGHQVGILTKFVDDTLVVVMLTHPETGEDFGPVTVPAADLQIARWMQIPAKRRPIDSEVAARLGYL